MSISRNVLRRLTLLCLAACTLAASNGRAQTVTSTFDTDADGWTRAAVGDSGTTVTFSATGGNPGGRIVLNDAGQGTFDYFNAPAKYLGNDSAYLNGTFSFQLMDDSSIDDLSAPVTLTDAAGNTLTHVLPAFSPGSYVSFYFTLNQSGGWTYTPAGGTGSAATQAQFQTVLANVSSLVVPGDFHNGPETTSLDNVVLTVSGPSASFFTGEVSLSNGVYYLSFPGGSYFGYYSYLTEPHYIYHFDLGYEYVFDAKDGKSGVYLYDFKSQHFFYTSPTFGFPYLYDFSLNAVLYYYPDPNNPGRYNTNGVRYFYNFATGQIITE